MKHTDDVILDPQKNNENDTPENFNAAVGKFIGQLAEWAKNYDGEPRPVSQEYLITVDDLLNDLSIFADDIYDGSFERDRNSLCVKFANGQIFRFTVTEECISE